MGHSLMNVCMACGQDLGPVRVDKLTCSPRCRTKLYRQRQGVKPASNSSYHLRQTLRLVKPIRFATLPKPTSHWFNDDDGRRVWVEPAQWDHTLTLANLLDDLLEQLALLFGWTGQRGWSRHQPSDDSSVSPICDIYVETIAELHAWLSTFQGHKASANRLLARHQASLADQLGTINRALREFVVDHQDRRDEYVIEFAGHQAVNALHRDVSLWWFELVEQTP
jgi:predicted nucleic acid-binding Zn ribbon protein